MKKIMKKVVGAMFSFVMAFTCAQVAPGMTTTVHAAEAVTLTTTMECSVWSAPATKEVNRVKKIPAGYAVKVYKTPVASTLGDGKTFYKTSKNCYILCKCFGESETQTQKTTGQSSSVSGDYTYGDPFKQKAKEDMSKFSEFCVNVIAERDSNGDYHYDRIVDRTVNKTGINSWDYLINLTVNKGIDEIWRTPLYEYYDGIGFAGWLGEIYTSDMSTNLKKNILKLVNAELGTNYNVNNVDYINCTIFGDYIREKGIPSEYERVMVVNPGAQTGMYYIYEIEFSIDGNDGSNAYFSYRINMTAN